MLDDRVCPSCDVVLPDGRTICPKCGKTVPYANTGHGFIDIPRKFYAGLVETVGPIGAGIIAGVGCLLLLALLIVKVLIKSIPAQ
jgi:hypothetical protein